MISTKIRSPLRSAYLLGSALALAVAAGGCAHTQAGQAGHTTTPASASASASAAPSSPEAVGIHIVPEHAVRATLKNGLRVVVVPNKLAPVATMEINYMVGSNEVPAAFPGTAHAQEHMMFRGSPGLSADQLADITASLGGDMDADTQQAVTQYYMTVPAEDLNVALHVGALRMKGVDDSEKLWRKERGAIEQEVANDNSSPTYVAYTKILKTLFAGTPYAHDGLGTRPSFDKTTAAMLKKFHDAWYVPNNAIMIVAGDVDPAKVIAKVKQLYGSIPRKALPARPAVNLKPVAPNTIVKMPTDQPFGLMFMAFRMPGYASKDFAASEILGDVLASRRGPLYALVPQGKALYAGFQNELFPETGIGFAIAVFPKGADTGALAKSLKGALTKAIKKGFSQDMIDASKRQEATQVELQKNSVSGLAAAWSEALAVEGRNSPEDDLRALVSVRAADVDQVAKKYLDIDHSVQVILTPQASGKPMKMKKGFGGKESFAPKKTESVKLPAWASSALARLSVPRSVVHPVVSTLPNGIRLIVQPEKVSDTVSVIGRIKSRAKLETPKGKDGVAGILDGLFQYGTTSLDRIAFQKALDDIGASESAGTDFSVEALASHFDRAVQLLAQNELHPALPMRAFIITRMQSAHSVAGRNKSPGYLTRRAVTFALVPKADPTRRQSTQKSVSSVGLADVKAYYKKVFRPDLTTIVVIGKVDPARAKQVITKYFGGWKATGPKPPTDLPKIPLNRASKTTVPDKARSQDRVTLAESLGLTRMNPDYYALELGNHVLGGGFYATRLYHDLREETGLVYFVSSSFRMGKTRGTYELSYGCDPPNVSKARKIAVRDLQAMRRRSVDKAALKQAKGILLRDIPLRESSAEEVAYGLIHRSILGLPLDEPTRAAKRYMKLTARQVRAAFHKWVDPRRLVQVVQGPTPK